MTGQRPYLPAVVGPAGSYVIAREVGRLIQEKARELQVAQPEAARQMLAGLASMRESGRQWFEGEIGASGSRPQAVSGSAELPPNPAESTLVSPPCTTSRAATRLRVSARQVRNLIEDEVLVAARKGRGWVIDEVSLAMEEKRRGLR